MVIHNIVILERTYVMNGTSGCNKSMTSSVDKLHAAKAETRSNNLLLILLTHYTQYCRTTQYCSVLHLTSYVFSINTHTHTHTNESSQRNGGKQQQMPSRSFMQLLFNYTQVVDLRFELTNHSQRCGITAPNVYILPLFFFHGIFPRSVFLFW